MPPRTVDLTEIDFADVMHPGDTVTWMHGSGEPISLIQSLLDQRHAIGPFRVVLGASYSNVVRPEHADVVRFVAFGAVGANRVLAAAGVLDIIPLHLSDLPRLATAGPLAADVVLLQLSQHPRTGEFSLGTVGGYLPEAIGRARTVIAEVNDQMPWTFATSPVAASDIDLIVRTSRPLVVVASRAPGEADRKVAGYIAGFIEDGTILQTGVGAIPNAVMQLLGDRRRLGVHSGLVDDGLVDLVEAGVVDNSTKAEHRGCSVVGALAGTRRLYQHAHLNPRLLIEPISYTHDHVVLRSLPQFVAVNSAVEVDLTGQVGAEAAGRKYVGTVGGQVDFARGALASPGGRSIIGLPSRVEKTGKARIVPVLGGAPVSTARSDADVIITEYGVAELRGRPIPDRVRQMIAIAHPADRDMLERQARDEVAGYRRLPRIVLR